MKSKNKNILFAFLIVAILIGSYFFANARRENPITDQNNSVTPTQTDSIPPDSQVNSTPLKSDNIIVRTPVQGTKISNPVVIKGEARTFENNVAVRITQSNGKVLAEDFTTAKSEDTGQFGPFEIQLSYSQPTQISGRIEVFQYSAKDGSEIDKVTVPVSFSSEKTLTLNAYFPSSNSQNCEAVIPVKRTVPFTQQTARAALEQLLKGTTSSEQQRGVQSQINTGVKINSLTIQNDIARVDFNEALQSGVAGSCRVQAIRSQITKTLLQFPTIKNVIISINGKSDEILQP